MCRYSGKFFEGCWSYNRDVEYFNERIYYISEDDCLMSFDPSQQIPMQTIEYEQVRTFWMGKKLLLTLSSNGRLTKHQLSEDGLFKPTLTTLIRPNVKYGEETVLQMNGNDAKGAC